MSVKHEAHPAPDRRHLTDSRPIRWDREATTSRASAAIDALLDDLEAWEPKRARKRRAADRGRLRVILEAVTLELWLARRDTPTRWLAYSRGDRGYVGPDRYRHPDASKTTVTLVTDFLTSTGLAEGRAGSYRREDHGFGQSGRGYLSRLRGTDGLLGWAGEQGLTDDDVALNDRFELIRLKGPAKTRRGRKPLLHYDDTPDTTAMRDRLRSWAAMMVGHEVTLGAHRTSGGTSPGDPLEDPLGDAEEFQARGAGSCRLYRILPVHDSFIVARRDERKLAETMALAYQGQLSHLVAAPAAPVRRPEGLHCSRPGTSEDGQRRSPDTVRRLTLVQPDGGY